MISGLAMMACQNLSVPPALMYHVAQVESHANPYAIGVVDGRLVRQPENLAEAIATANALEAKGYNFSVGLAQVNKANLIKYGLDTWKKAFSVCPNLVAGSQILAGCYAAAHGVWGKAFSCYYSGDFTTGYRDGYVKKIYASLGQATPGSGSGRGTGAASPIAVVPAKRTAPVRILHSLPAFNNADYRVAIRSEVLDSVAGALVLPVAKSIARQSSALLKSAPVAAVKAGAHVSSGPPAGASDVDDASANAPFVPQVTGPNGAAPLVASNGAATHKSRAPSTLEPDPASANRRVRDAAFVF